MFASAQTAARRGPNFGECPAVKFPCTSMRRVANERVAAMSTKTSAVRSATLPDLLSAQAALTPSAPAVVCGKRRMTYAELNAAADRLAFRLLCRGVAPQTRIAVLLDRSIDLVVVLLAILKAGSAYVPLDPTYPAKRLAYVLANARPAAIVSKSSLVGRISE